jgi:IS4 transposase
MVITDGVRHEAAVVKRHFPINPDSIYCFDRGYTDYGLFKRISEARSYFVTRPKETMDFRIAGQHTETMKKGILSDEVINLNNDKYVTPLRLIRYYDDESGEILSFITNNFKLSPYTITQIYKSRWQIEIFFKWIKQNLKIKTFLGTNENAVMAQIWVAMCYYLMLTYIKYQCKYRNSLFYLHRVISETILYRMNLIDLFRASRERLRSIKLDEIQLTFL